MIVYDKRPTGALPTISDILASVEPNAPNQQDNIGRFTILRRLDVILLGNPTTTADMTSCTFKDGSFYLDLKGLPVVYKSAGTGAIGDIEQGALYSVAVGDHAAGTTAAEYGRNPDGAAMLKYIDM